MRRSDVDDAAAAARLHAGNDRLAGVESRRQVDRQDGVPLLDREFLDRRDKLDAGVVDQHIDAAESFLGAGDHRVDLVRPGHVGRGIGDVDRKFLRQSQPQRLYLGRVAEAVQHHVHALRAEGAGDAQADAAGGAGDDCGASRVHDGPRCRCARTGAHGLYRTVFGFVHRNRNRRGLAQVKSWRSCSTRRAMKSATVWMRGMPRMDS